MSSSTEDARTHPPTPEDTANPLFRTTTYYWLSPLIKLGSKRPLDDSDLYDLPVDDVARKQRERLETAWNEQQAKVADTPDKSPSLFYALLAVFKQRVGQGAMFKLCQDFFVFVGPVFLQFLLQWVNGKSTFTTQSPPPVWEGYVHAFILAFSALAQTQFLNAYFNRMLKVGIHIRMSLTTLIFAKAMRLSNKARASTDTGKVVNLMSTDAQRLELAQQNVNMVWSAPLQITVSVILLSNLLGWSTAIGLGLMIVLIPVQIRLAGKLGSVQRRLLKVMDERVKLMNEILTGIRVIKFYAWEKPFLGIVDEVRAREVALLRKLLLIQAFNMTVIGSVPVLVAVATFASHVALFGGTLSPEIVFPAIVLFNIIRFPLSFLPMVIINVVESRIALRRIGDFLNLEEQKLIQPGDDTPAASPSASGAGQDTRPVVVSVRNATFTYDHQRNVLEDVNLEVRQGELLMVIGGVGSGKSSLLAALLGEIDRTAGDVHVTGTTAYVSQVAWIQNACLRDNILFGLPYDEELYSKTIEVSALTQDLEVLPDGDDTEIGERGINLSGGQKQRVNIARAVYHRCDIVLMDDSLSAVDAHVGKHIFDKCIAGMMSDSTRIVATNQLQFLPQADRIVILKDGRIQDHGTYAELIARGFDLHSIVDADDAAPAALPDSTEEPATGNGSDNDNANDNANDDANDNVKKGKHRRRRSSAGSSTQADAVKVIAPEPSKPGAVGKSQHHGKSARQGQGKTTTVESREVGKLSNKVYGYYIAAIGGVGAMLFLLVCYVVPYVAQVISDLYLAAWADGQYQNRTLAVNLGYYGGFGLGSAVLLGARAVFNALINLGGARRLHTQMLHNVVHMPTSFFDETPIGRVINRFSKDMQNIDVALPTILGQFFFIAMVTAVTLGVVIAVTGWVSIPIFGIAILYYRYQGYFRHSSRELKRLDSVSRSPIYAHFSESLVGVSTIRAYNRAASFVQQNEERVDNNARPAYLILMANRWLAVRLEGLGAGLTLSTALVGVYLVSSGSGISAGLIGLSVSYSLAITNLLNFSIRMLVEVENQMNAVERFREYSLLPVEAAPVIADHRPPTDWPSQGAIEFRKVQMRYRPDLPPVLKGIDLTIKPREKIGIVGRTGAGKSSIMMTLFRIVDGFDGSIIIDDVDTKTIGLEDLRSRLSIIPQDPVVFSGTIRSNLDPFKRHTDDEIWAALDEVQMKAMVQRHDNGLDFPVEEGGNNLSIGERQLLCIARALLRKTRVLLMDEATSAVDFDTDAVIQSTVRRSFADCTVLTIAHRLNTIMDSDRVLVLDDGKVLEFAPPLDLLADSSSSFYDMVHATGEGNAQYLEKLARGDVSASDVVAHPVPADADAADPAQL